MATIGRVLLIPKGDYSGSAIYNKLDWVRDNGKAWVCKVDGTQGVTPTEGANWTLLAADGNVSGSVEWSAVNNKPFSTVSSSDFTVTAGGELQITGGGGGDTVSWNQIQTSTGATKIAEITINSTSTDVYAPSGGGSSTFSGLSDTDINDPQVNQIVQYKNVGGSMKLQNVAMPQGGHTMLPTPDASVDEDDVVSAVNTGLLEGGANDDIASLYGVGVWANTDCIQLVAEVDQGDDGLGTWLDTDWESGTRSGWLWDESLYQILEDGNNNRRYDIHIEPIFDAGEGEVVSLYSMRIDDDVTVSNTHGGAIAFKFNGEIQNTHAYVGVKLTKLRTKYKVVTPLP